jgi:hypothetical protein
MNDIEEKARTLAAEFESATNVWEVTNRQLLAGQAFGHVDFQREVTTGMIKITRGIRDGFA